MDNLWSLQHYKTVDICRTSRDFFTLMETSTLPVKAYLLGAYENLTLRIILRATLTSKGFEHPTYTMRGERSTDRSTAALMWQTINQYNKIYVSRSTRFSSLKNKNNISYEKLKQQKPYNAA